MPSPGVPREDDPEGTSRWRSGLGATWRGTWRGTKATGRGMAYLVRGIAPAWRFVARAPHVVLIAVAAVLFVVDASTIPNLTTVTFPLSLFVAAVDVAPLLLVRYWPFGAWLAATGVALGWYALVTPPGVNDFPWSVCQYLVQLVLLLLVAMLARWAEVVLAAAGSLAAAVVLLPGDHKAWAVANAAVVVLGLLVRWLVLSRRQLAAQSRATAQERDLRAVVEERARIARELHDVVAHHMSMVVVQAQSAPVRLGDLPPEAVAEFAAIETAARQALTEVRGVLGVLREPRDGAQLAPQPGLAQMAGLLESSRAAGMDLTWRLGLTDADCPPATALMLHRVLQEALANAARHSPGAAVEVVLRREDGGAALLVRNAAVAERGPAPVDGGGGNGIPGMRARAEAVGGTLAAGPTSDGGYLVEAHVPLAGRPARSTSAATA